MVPKSASRDGDGSSDSVQSGRVAAAVTVAAEMRQKTPELVEK